MHNITDDIYNIEYDILQSFQIAARFIPFYRSYIKEKLAIEPVFCKILTIMSYWVF